MENLRTCPFCGGEAYLTANYSPKIKRYFIFAKCEDCGATGAAKCSKESPEVRDWETPACGRAIDAWNARTEDPMTYDKAVKFLAKEDPETLDEILHGEW